MVTVDVVVRNLTGHKFPTGYPSRRAWLHFVARDANGNALFESGGVDGPAASTGNGSDADADGFEPHYDEITSADQVQIYESIMGTPSGMPTTGLLQATRYLKDNRLLPRGFDKATAASEIAVIGDATATSDFIGGEDRVRYRMPAAGVASVTAGTALSADRLPLGAQPRTLRRGGAACLRALLRYPCILVVRRRGQCDGEHHRALKPSPRGDSIDARAWAFFRTSARSQPEP